MKSNALAIGSVVIAALAVSGCNSIAGAAGMTKKTPDEFNVVTKAPLVVPPEFGLRPPAVGAEMPAELNPETRGRQILFGQDLGQAASQGEKVLVAKAGANSTDASIRTRIDFENGEVMRKTGSFADKVLGFMPGAGSKTLNTEDGTIDADAEAQRLKDESTITTATGGGTVVIERGKPGVKLPGT